MTGGLALTWWGHASATVAMGDVRVAVDPLLGDRLLHLRRYTALPAAESTDADVVLISHLHHDHLHLPRCAARGGVPILVPRGGESLLRGLGADRVLPVAPGDALDVGGATIRVLDATHDGGRGPQPRSPARRSGSASSAPAGRSGSRATPSCARTCTTSAGSTSP